MKNIILNSLIFILAISCNAQNSYLKKVQKNIDEIESIEKYTRKNTLFEKKDSLKQIKNIIHLPNNICLYNEDVNDLIIENYIKKYDFDRICLEIRNDYYFNKVIIFHKSYNPIFGKSIVIQYDFGNSPLRDRIKQGIKNENEYYSVIINDFYIYSINNKPSFGE